MPYLPYNLWLKGSGKTLPLGLIERLEPWRTSRFPLGLLSSGLWRQAGNDTAVQEPEPWSASGVDALPDAPDRRDPARLQTAAFSIPVAATPKGDPNLQPARGGASIGGDQSVYERLKRLTPEQLDKLGYPLFGEMWRQYRGG